MKVNYKEIKSYGDCLKQFIKSSDNKLEILDVDNISDITVQQITNILLNLGVEFNVTKMDLGWSLMDSSLNGYLVMENHKLQIFNKVKNIFRFNSVKLNVCFDNSIKKISFEKIL